MRDFFTTDIGLATVLQTTGFNLKGLDKSDVSRIKFLFESDESLNQVLAAHYQNKLQLSSLALLSNFRSLKNLLHQQ